MSSPDIVGWFDNNWMGVRERALKSGWDSLPRRDQVLVAVGFLLDGCIGDGVWAIVDGVVEGSDEGLTVRMPAALEDVGLPKVAEHVRSIIRLRAPTGSPAKVESNRSEALGHWGEINDLFEEWIPGGERVMLTKLYDWYHTHTEQGNGGKAAAPDKPAKPQASKVKNSPGNKRK